MNENKIAEDIYRINLSVNLSSIKNINIHLIKNINGYTLIDTGWNIEGKTDELLNKLNELQINLDEINQIILTHLHIDHFGLVNKLRKLTKFELLANPRELIFYKNFEANIFNKLLSYTGFQEVEIKEIMQMLNLIKNIIPTKIDRWLYGNEIIKSRKNESIIISTPGHTPGNLSIYNSKEKLLISGDHILPNITSNITFYPFIKNYNPLEDYFKSLNKSIWGTEVLDVGSGLCVFLGKLKKYGPRLHCIDPSPVSIEHAIKTVEVNTAFQGDFFDFESKKKYDLITFNKILEHIKNPIVMLSKAKELLKDDGTIYIELPDGRTASKNGGFIDREEFYLEHYTVFTEKSVKYLVNSVGLNIRIINEIHECSDKYTIYAFINIP